MLSRKTLLVTSVLVLIILLSCYFFIPAVNGGINEAFEILTSGDEARIKDWVSDFGLWGPLVIIVGMVASMFLFVVPNLLLLIISSVSYGPLWGSLISLVAVFISSTVAYSLGYWIGPSVLKRLVGSNVHEKMTRLVRLYGVGVIVLFRMSPLLSNEAISFIPALLRMKYKKFILATLAGSVPVIAILAYTAGEGNFKTVMIWLSIISLVGYAVYLFIGQRVRSRRKKNRKAEGESKTPAYR